MRITQKMMHKFTPKKQFDMSAFRIASPADDDDIWECIICGDEGNDDWIERHMKKEHLDDIFDEEYPRYVRRKN